MPLSAPEGFAAWALANLILAVLGAITTVVFAVIRRLRKEDKDEDEQARRQETYAQHYGAEAAQYNAQAEEKENKRHRRSLVWLVITTVLALAGVILFILTENIFLPMVWVDGWTIVQAIILIAAIVLGNVAISRKKEKVEEEDAAQASV